MFKKIKLPEDCLPHDENIEWWYFNGHLKTKNGDKYSFMDCLFKANPSKLNIPYFSKILGKKRTVYFAHSVLADIKKAKSYKEIQNISIMSQDSFKRPLYFANYCDFMAVANGYVNHEIAEITPNVFHLKTKTIDLILTSKKPPLLENGNGYISVANKFSYYYSLTDLETKGKINIEGKWLEVEGRSWFDHQWANGAYNKDQWTWFCFKLNNGTDIMCVEYDNGKTKDYLVDLIKKDGTQKHYKKVEMTAGKDHFYSHKTKAKYPLSWTLKIPGEKLELKVKALLSDQEIIYGPINYWEGPVTVTGGVGFMELVGYPSNYNPLVLAGSDLAKKIKKTLMK
jgi:predicted secreted hydrolase